MAAVFSGFSVWVLITVALCLRLAECGMGVTLEARLAIPLPSIHTRSEVSSDSDSTYDSASVASVASVARVNQP